MRAGLVKRDQTRGFLTQSFRCRPSEREPTKLLNRANDVSVGCPEVSMLSGAPEGSIRLQMQEASLPCRGLSYVIDCGQQLAEVLVGGGLKNDASGCCAASQKLRFGQGVKIRSSPSLLAHRSSGSLMAPAAAALRAAVSAMSKAASIMIQTLFAPGSGQPTSLRSGMLSVSFTNG